MELNFQYIVDSDGLQRAVDSVGQANVIGFDTETTELDPFKGELRLVQLSDGKTTHVIDIRSFSNGVALTDNADVEPLRKLLSDPTKIKVAHNAKFDAKWVSHHLGVECSGLFDTYLASQLAAAGDPERRHSLADVAQVYLSLELDKTMQVSDWSSAELSHAQVEYAARDAAIMPRLHSKLSEQLKESALEKISGIEFDCIAPITAMELNGFYLDRARWNEQIEKAQIAMIKSADELQEMLSSGVAQASLFGRSEINLDSQNQVTDALKNLGVPVPESTQAWQLQPLADDYPVIAKLLEYRGVAKSLTSFGSNILDFIEPQTGRIHADFRQIGAPTGRFSCSNPNLQQIPHTNDYRRCFTAPAGRKLVIADYSQIELRILADFSDDENFINAFVSGQDFHSATAAQVFGIKPDDVTESQRSFAKRLNFGIVYGIGASRFASMTGLTQTEAENTMRKYFGTFRKLDLYLRDSGNRIVQEKNVRTAAGRMLRLRFDETNRQEISSAKRYGTNMPIQGTSADILKRALRILHESIRGSSTKLVNIIHDEIILECDEADAAQNLTLLENSMKIAGEELIKKVPIEVEVRVADDWTK